MHVFANTPHSMEQYRSFVGKSISFGAQLVFLFMMISAFSMFCGYYDRMKSGTISINDFYKRRYHRVWPFFAILTLLDLAFTHSLNGLYEAFANLTLCFNLLPSPDIKCIGVGWFLGTIFLFYMLFPFFVFLLDNKRRAWFVLPIAVIFNIIANIYFFHEPFVVNLFHNGWANMINCAPYFVLGGIIFLYKDSIHNWVNSQKTISSLMALLALIAFALTYENNETPEMFLLKALLFTVICSYALIERNILLSNKLVKYLSGISMEIYLSHMVLFRAVQMIHPSNFSQDEWTNYSIVLFLTIVTTILFAHVVKYLVLPNLDKWFSRIPIKI